MLLHLLTHLRPGLRHFSLLRHNLHCSTCLCTMARYKYIDWLIDWVLQHLEEISNDKRNGRQFTSLQSLPVGWLRTQRLVSPQSVLRPASRHNPMRVFPRCVLQCLCMGGDNAALGCLLYSVQHGLEFHWPLKHYTPYIWQATVQSEVRPPCPPGHSMVGASVTLMQCVAHSHLLSESRHSIQLRHPYSWLWWLVTIYRGHRQTLYACLGI